ncbi:hypothetical protein HJV72_03160 [Extibacter sp. GGCC_0201]|nr:hypothetical protein [Extibacter sp. GGCC_0201]
MQNKASFEAAGSFVSQTPMGRYGASALLSQARGGCEALPAEGSALAVSA